MHLREFLHQPCATAKAKAARGRRPLYRVFFSRELHELRELSMWVVPALAGLCVLNSLKFEKLQLLGAYPFFLCDHCASFVCPPQADLVAKFARSVKIRENSRNSWLNELVLLAASQQKLLS